MGAILEALALGAGALSAEFWLKPKAEDKR